jgi:predicted nucleic acid-binding protein
VSAVVSDASPLINLARVGRFDLLTAFYGRIVIPQAVYDEVVVRGQRRDGSREVKDASWIEVRVPQDELAVRALAAELGGGEAAAIILAQELQAALLLIDEIRGRRVAQQRKRKGS